MISDKQIEHHFLVIRRQLAALRGKDAAWGAIDAALEDLRVTYEQMRTNLETIEVVQEELLQKNQYYQDLFQLFPIASSVTDANGVILEANQAVAQLLNVSRRYLIGKPLTMFVAMSDSPSGELRSNRTAFRTHLNRLSRCSDTQIWQTTLCPRNREPVVVELHAAVVRDKDGRIANLRIGLYNLSHSQHTLSSLNQQERLEKISTVEKQPVPQLPSSLDGLRVLVVDDEADAREFVIAVLSSYGIRARAVASAAEALEELEEFRPDVLLSDIRMPDGDGYSLIRQIRALEAKQGRHLPAAAMTAYFDEDGEKAIAAGFEAHLHKLAQPANWIETVAALAEQSFTS
jgi:PAS domain S-box-containing protein